MKKQKKKVFHKDVQKEGGGSISVEFKDFMPAGQKTVDNTNNSIMDVSKLGG